MNVYKAARLPSQAVKEHDLDGDPERQDSDWSSRIARRSQVKFLARNTKSSLDTKGRQSNTEHMTDWVDPDGWPRDRYSGVGGGLYTGVGGGLYTGVGGGAYSGVGGGAYTGVGGGAYTGVGGGLYTGPGGGCYTGPGGGLYTGPGGGCYTGPGGGLYTGIGGGAYAGVPTGSLRRNWPPIPILISHLRQIGLGSHADLIAKVYGL